MARTIRRVRATKRRPREKEREKKREGMLLQLPIIETAITLRHYRRDITITHNDRLTISFRGEMEIRSWPETIKQCRWLMTRAQMDPISFPSPCELARIERLFASPREGYQ